MDDLDPAEFFADYSKRDHEIVDYQFYRLEALPSVGFRGPPLSPEVLASGGYARHLGRANDRARQRNPPRAAQAPQGRVTEPATHPNLANSVAANTMNEEQVFVEALRMFFAGVRVRTGG